MTEKYLFSLNTSYSRLKLFKNFHLQDTLEGEKTKDLQMVHLYCNINYSLACLYVDLDMLDQAEHLHKDVLTLRER